MITLINIVNRYSIECEKNRFHLCRDTLFTVHHFRPQRIGNFAQHPIKIKNIFHLDTSAKCVLLLIVTIFDRFMVNKTKIEISIHE